MNKKTRDALTEEMPSIVRHINRIIASNPDLRNAGLRFNGLTLLETDPDPDIDIVNNRAAFRAFIQPNCDDFKTCTLIANRKITYTACIDEDCLPGFE